jgi:hypothetical protein
MKTFTFVKDYRKSFPYIVYKTVSQSHVQVGFTLASRELVQKWLSGSTTDPIIKILSRNSNLTKTQLETLLIDFLGPNISGKSLTNQEKALLRLTKAGISRGAFNHTLKQARRNIIQSMYTIILLGYLGIFEDTRLDPYLEVANKLKEYIGAYKDVISNNELATEHLRIVTMLREELETTLEKLSTKIFVKDVISQITFHAELAHISYFIMLKECCFSVSFNFTCRVL